MAYKVLAKSYLGYCKKNNTDNNMIIIHVHTIIWCFTQLMGLIVGAGRPCERIDRIPTRQAWDLSAVTLSLSLSVCCVYVVTGLPIQHKYWDMHNLLAEIFSSELLPHLYTDFLRSHTYKNKQHPPCFRNISVLPHCTLRKWIYWLFWHQMNSAIKPLYRNTIRPVM